jgi:hypothetical protein
MPATVTDPAVLREAILSALAEGPATWIQVQARAGGNLDIVAAGLVLTELEAEGRVQHSREPGAAQSVYRSLALGAGAV